jgi:hypothetical protein
MIGTRVRPSLSWPTVLVLASMLLRVPAFAQICVGDCPPPDGQVAVNELVLGVNIALGASSIGACPSYDVNGDGTVSVAELVMAVKDAEEGCPGAPTPPASIPAGATPTPTATWTLAPGPVISFFGVTLADNSLQTPTATDPSGIPIYARPFGISFQLVVEARGRFRSEDVGHLGSTFAAGGTPDLQIQSTRNLGNGSAAVCDVTPPNFGGVPGIDPPQLGDPNAIADQLNDFGCRFVNGEGGRSGRACGEACVRFADGEYHCVDPDADVEFCAPMDNAMRFPSGDTLLTVRARDASNQLGPPAQIIIRIP